MSASRVYGSIQDRPGSPTINDASNDLARLRVHFACADAFSRALARNMTRREFLSRDAQEQMISLTQLPPKSQRVKSLQRTQFQFSSDASDVHLQRRAENERSLQKLRAAEQSFIVKLR
jgi:hypothetical protein